MAGAYFHLSSKMNKRLTFIQNSHHHPLTLARAEHVPIANPRKARLLGFPWLGGERPFSTEAPLKAAKAELYWKHWGLAAVLQDWSSLWHTFFSEYYSSALAKEPPSFISSSTLRISEKGRMTWVIDKREWHRN